VRYKIEMSLRGGRIKGEGLAISGDGLIELALGAKDVAEVGMIWRSVGCDGDGLADQVGGGVTMPALVGDDAQKMERVGLGGL